MAKSTRRGNGEGSIFQRNDGRWVAKIQTGVKEDGKPIVKNFYGQKRKDVVDKLKEFKLTQSQGFDKIDKVTIKEYITNWLKVVKVNSLRENSYDRLENVILNHIVPNIGHIELAELTAMDIQAEIINKMVKDGFAHSMVVKVCSAVNSCLKYALNNRQIQFNPYNAVELPKKSRFKKTQIEIFSDEERLKIETQCELTAKNGNFRYKTGSAFILMLYTGIRTSEMLGLQWKNVDFENRKIYIKNNIVIIRNRNKKDGESIQVVQEQEFTKTKKSEREIELCDRAYNALVNLQKTITYDPKGFVVCTKDGNPIRPRNFRNSFDTILKRANVPLRGLHTLRHTFASMLFAKGVDVKTVSELLGHANVQTTYNTYIHIIPKQRKNAVGLLDL